MILSVPHEVVTSSVSIIIFSNHVLCSTFSMGEMNPIHFPCSQHGGFVDQLD